MKQYKQKIKLTKNQHGFTLIEMIVAISIFVLILLIATNIYFIVNNTQRKVVTMQRIQSDVRYLYEAIAQEIRLGRINYDFYNDNGIDLHPNATEYNTVLAVVNRSGDSVFFRLSSGGDKVQYCEISIDNDCDLGDDSLWQDITPEGVVAEDLRFIITPSADPFTDTTGLPCSIDNDCIGNYISYRCDNIVDNRCEYHSDGNNFQPKVQIVLKTRGTAKNIIEESEMLMQTTVSSRILPGKAENINYD